MSNTPTNQIALKQIKRLTEQTTGVQAKDNPWRLCALLDLASWLETGDDYDSDTTIENCFQSNKEAYSDELFLLINKITDQNATYLREQFNTTFNRISERKNVFFVVDSPEGTPEIFETYAEAEKNALEREFSFIYLANIRNAYKETDGSWNYADRSDTFQKIINLT